MAMGSVKTPIPMLPFRMWMIVSKFLKKVKICLKAHTFQRNVCLRYSQFVISIFLDERTSLGGWCRRRRGRPRFCIGVFSQGRQSTQIWWVLANRYGPTAETFDLVHDLRSGNSSLSSARSYSLRPLDRGWRGIHTSIGPWRWERSQFNFNYYCNYCDDLLIELHDIVGIDG